MTTATDSNGIVHDLASRDRSVCGEPATSWSREVTQLQVMGPVIFCDRCRPAGDAATPETVTTAED